MGDMLTTRQVAEMLGCSVTRVQLDIKAGRYPGVVKSSKSLSYFIPRDQVEVAKDQTIDDIYREWVYKDLLTEADRQKIRLLPTKQEE